MASEDHGRTQVHLQRAVDLLIGVLQQRSGARHGRVGDEEVDVAGFGEQALDLGGLLEVDRERARSQLVGERLEHVRAPPGQYELHAASVQRAGDRMPDASGRPCQQRLSSGQMLGHWPNTASVAVKPCRWDRAPTGPISPAAKNPATGAPDSAASAASASWSAVPNIARPRPLQVNISAPAGPSPPNCILERPSTSRRSTSALEASRTCRRTTSPGSTCAPTASAPVSGSAPSSARTRKSPRSNSGLPASTTVPSNSPSAILSRSFAGRPAIASRSAVSAGRPASSWIMWPSAAVIVISGPIGAAPCDTAACTRTPSNATPTAPSAFTSSPQNSAALPSSVRALEMPPRIGVSDISA